MGGNVPIVIVTVGNTCDNVPRTTESQRPREPGGGAIYEHAPFNIEKHLSLLHARSGRGNART